MDVLTAHTNIPGPKIDRQSYYDRKGSYSVILQVICDSDMKFIDVFAGWPGSSNDARVWKNSNIYKMLKDQNSSVPTNCHLLGDSAYPLDLFIMVPYRDNGHLTDKQRYYNKKLSSKRVIIEQAIGLLKNRFRRLKHLDMRCLKMIPKVIMTSCILHNICLNESDYCNLESEAEESGEELYIDNNRNCLAGQKRDQIADYLYNNRQ